MRTLPKEGRVAVVTDAPLEAVWDLVRDPTLVGEWSHECHGAVWVEGATGAAPGARFQGRNRVGHARWSRTSEVVAVEERRRLVWRTVPSPVFRDSTEWTIELEPDGTGTRIEQRFRVLAISPFLDRLFALVIPPHRDRSAALEGDLRRLGEVAARRAHGA